MGRAFEYRKARKFERWANMAKTFTKIGREIAIAVRQGGGDPDYNLRLRLIFSKNGGIPAPPARSIACFSERAPSKLPPKESMQKNWNWS